ncbi:MAG TPA: SDR family oxidoreductase [Polyangiales bacterium]
MDSESLMSAQWSLVTGASRGIGRAVVELLLARGRSVIACARESEQLRELAQNERVAVLPCDLAQPGAAQELIERATALGPLRELVLAAGVAQHAAFANVGERALRAQLELNFFAPFFLIQHAAARMERGAIVAIGSTLAFRAAPTTSAYAASKAALLSLVRGAALELAPRIRVNALAPGVVDTAMIRAPRRDPEPGEDPVSVIAEQLEALRALHPLGRLGTPEEVADAVLYLLEAPWLTGSVLTLDGGLTLS